MSTPSGGRVAWLAHPVTLLSLTVLIVNDHVLKDRYPGFVTGKLSDVAGLVLLPPLLALAVPRRAALWIAGAGFVVVKTLPAAAGAASAVWSAVVGPSVIHADVTDLLALPALGLAWWAGRTARPGTGRVGAIATLVLLPLAALAVAATAAPQYPSALQVWASGDRVVAGLEVAYRPDFEPTGWQVSADGGRTWAEAAPDDAVRRPVEESRQACEPAAADHCYRVVPGHLRVEETTDGGSSWRVAWGVDEDRRKRLARHYDDLVDPARELSSLSVAVVARPGGHAVVVANGRDGFAVRDPDGTWERIGFRGLKGYPGSPPPLEARSLLDVAPELALGVLGTLLALLVVAGVAHWPARRWPAFAAAPVFGLGALSAYGGAVWFRNTGELLALPLLVFGAVVAVGCAVALVATLAVAGAAGRRAVATVSLAGVTGAAAVVGVYVAWTGSLVGDRVAALCAVGVAVAVLATGVQSVLRRPAPPRR